MPFALRGAECVFAVVACTLLSCSAAFSQGRVPFDQDVTRAKLLTLGQQGEAIERARERVLEILEGHNPCSEWFGEAAADPAAAFASLQFALDKNGPSDILGLPNKGDILFKQPYSGRALEHAGPHAVITINANGPFFVRRAIVMKQDLPGSAPRRLGWQTLNVASYDGSSLEAQMATLLHELGHVIGRIPDDPDELSGQSGRNTARVLQYCRGEIKTATRRARRTEKGNGARAGQRASLRN